jgi:hypothetical protein
MKICVLKEDLVVIVGFNERDFSRLSRAIAAEGVDLHVIAFGDGELMDLRGAPRGVTTAARRVAEWVESKLSEPVAADT